MAINSNLDQIRALMDNQNSIRNFSFIGLLSHGKSTLFEQIIKKSEAGGNSSQRAIKPKIYESDHVTLQIQHETVFQKQSKQQYLLNMIDTPGHFEFSYEVSTSLRISDGAVIVVDSTENIFLYVEKLIIQALREKIKPVLVLNKIDKFIIGQELEGEIIYETLNRIVESVNIIISVYKGQDFLKDFQINPQIGNVMFGSASMGWGFQISTFSKIYQKKFGLSEEKMREKLWGDHYFDPAQKKWQIQKANAQNGTPLKRGFVQFILEPIVKVFKSIMDGNKDLYLKILQTLNITIEDNKLQGFELLKYAMQKWVDITDSLIDMIVMHIPSPKAAQIYRSEWLLKNVSTQNKLTRSMISCDSAGPLIIYISKMIPNIQGKLIAFGRVFSGTVSAESKEKSSVKIQSGESEKYANIKAYDIGILVGTENYQNISSVPCGNLVALIGIDTHFLKSATIISANTSDFLKIKEIKFIDDPKLFIEVQPQNQQEMPQFYEVMKLINQINPCFNSIKIDDTGANQIYGLGQLFIEKMLELFKQRNIAITQSKHWISYRETVTEQSNQICLAKSTNKHHRIYGKAYQIEEDTCQFIEQNDENTIQTYLKDTGQIIENQKLWSFGPDSLSPNMLVDTIIGVPNVHAIKDKTIHAWKQASNQAVLIEEQMRGVRVDLEDLHFPCETSGYVNKGFQSIVPTAKRLFYACQLTAQPMLMEPILFTEIKVPSDQMVQVYNCVNNKQGNIIEEIQDQLNKQLTKVNAFIPLEQFLGFQGYLSDNTQGLAYIQSSFFDHWQIVNSSPFDVGGRCEKIILEVRHRKGMQEEMPDLTCYLDKL